ncbi:MAG TPA: FAD-dependent oxidoreductase [Solirubrobacteraceae bacterium]|jgi:thioredoxin reductase (NADPH)
MTLPVGDTTSVQIRAADFPDLADEVMYPRISAQKLERLAEHGTRRSFSVGETLYAQGQRDTPFLVLERGRVRVLDRKPGKVVWVADAEAGTFLGDIATFTGEPAIAECVADEPTDVIAFERSALRAMLASWPDFAEIVLRTMMVRREWHEAHGYGVARLIAPRGSRRAFEVRDLLERNLIPVRWYDVDTDEDSTAMLDWLQISREETPVLVRNSTVLRNPSAAQVARDLGLRAEIDGERFDLVVLGGGPAGLAAAVSGGAEGLRSLVAEAWAPGGQAGTSTRIENYLGFPTGISGTELTRKATLQARRFDAVVSSFHRAVELARGPEGLVRIDLDDGQHALARTVVVATGARWRTLAADNLERFTGAGVYHAVMASDADRCRGEDVVVVGGGNSAGQAAMHLSRAARSVRVVIRDDALTATMSRYLLERIESRPNVEVMSRTELTAVHGKDRLEQADLRSRLDGKIERVAVSAVFVMIGAEPRTEAVRMVLDLDEDGYIRCGDGAAAREGPNGSWSTGREPYLLETVWPGVFAAGDVRAGATKRVAAAVGDGALAVRFAHELLRGLN